MTSVLDTTAIGKCFLDEIGDEFQTGYLPEQDSEGKEKWPRGEENLKAWKDGLRSLDAGVPSITKSIVNHVQTSLARQPHEIDNLGAYQAAALSVRDNLIINWNETQLHYSRIAGKRAYYLSLEFLMGRALDNALLNLGLKQEYTEGVDKLGFNMEDLLAQERDAGLSNVISGKNIRVPPWRVPAGIYISINVDSRRRWKSAISVLSSEESAAWADTVTLSPQASPAFSVETRASYEADRILDLSFPSVRGVHPSLALNVALYMLAMMHCLTCGSRTTCQMRRVSHLQAAVQHFQLVLDQCPVSHPDHTAALTNLAWARLEVYAQNDLQEIDATTSLFRKALVLRPQPHPDHTYDSHIISYVNWRHGDLSDT
ncbi:hypothetical protein EV702DRAFT_1205005 [Suillus placidus]|uniref:Uncharacterized protein n=1 Tax=Suillus placidus TaxID=48579 RepID=A0A9P7CV30_9AGAM|nr:hypothetical protein EV702DRAFT_1205005 [Suillus placidus]